ncbi:MAG: hypothetical protein JW779_06665 [Candidatus Thorarchaeota archaeon]|nr:hypothetical protein [Candidatus Thorarchaeota archaeon]
MSTNEKEEIVPKTTIRVYGGKKETVGESVNQTLGLRDDQYYSTWISLGVMKRFAFLFEGGVESAGSIGGLVLMFIVLVITLLFFALWQFVVFFLVIAVLTLLSGGAAAKFLRATYITTPLDNIDVVKIQEFVKIQVREGHFVRVDEDPRIEGKDDTIHRISQATKIFKNGIQFSLVVATIFLIVQVLYWFMNHHWITGSHPITGESEILILVAFGIFFLAGVLAMDLGVLLRRRIANSLQRPLE